jgi:hypothetical protein
MGASGQWCLISGYHFDVTFSKDDGLVTLKQIKNTSVWKCQTSHIIALAKMEETSTFSLFSKKSKIWKSQISPVSVDGSMCEHAKEDKSHYYSGHCPSSRFKDKVSETGSVSTIKCKGGGAPTQTGAP